MSRESIERNARWRIIGIVVPALLSITGGAHAGRAGR